MRKIKQKRNICNGCPFNKECKKDTCYWDVGKEESKGKGKD